MKITIQKEGVPMTLERRGVFSVVRKDGEYFAAFRDKLAPITDKRQVQTFVFDFEEIRQDTAALWETELAALTEQAGARNKGKTELEPRYVVDRWDFVIRLEDEAEVDGRLALRQLALMERIANGLERLEATMAAWVPAAPKKASTSRKKPSA